MHLDNGFSLGHHKVIHAFRHHEVGACGKIPESRGVQFVAIPAEKVPCSTVMCSSVGCQCAAILPPSGILPRIVNIPGLDGSPLRTLICIPEGKPVLAGEGAQLISPGMYITGFAAIA